SAAVAAVLALRAPSGWTVPLAAVVAVVLALRARAFPLVAEVVVLLIAAACVAVRLLVVWAEESSAAAPLAVLVALAVAPLVVLAVQPAEHVRVRLRRAGDLVESVGVTALLPLLVGVFGVYGRLLDPFACGLEGRGGMTNGEQRREQPSAHHSAGVDGGDWQRDVLRELGGGVHGPSGADHQGGAKPDAATERVAPGPESALPVPVAGATDEPVPERPAAPAVPGPTPARATHLPAAPAPEASPTLDPRLLLAPGRPPHRDSVPRRTGP